jgi:RecB family exonuclease
MEAEVDRIWGELSFEARWQSEAERVEAREALRRFLGYHERAERELLETESGRRARVDVVTPSGVEETVTVTGFIDRIEQDDSGRLVAIDLKNMRNIVPVKDIPEHGQLGIYQLLLQRGEDPSVAEESGEAPEPAALSEVETDPARETGGAALVQLRIDEGRGSTQARVQFQEPLVPDDSGRTWIESRLGEAVEVLRAADVVATAGPACTYCAYARTCPAQPEGTPVIP